VRPSPASMMNSPWAAFTSRKRMCLHMSCDQLA
jgi:hypothetical protein